MYLRTLELKDATGMLEWIKDNDINRYFRFNPDLFTEESVKDFILRSKENSEDKHYAIINQDDIYLGTISLKKINCENKNAEYAISLRSCAIGTGIAREATDLILNYAFYDLSLNKVYLNVLSENLRAIRFYEKYGFLCEGIFKEHIYKNNIPKDLVWYRITKAEYINRNISGL